MREQKSVILKKLKNRLLSLHAEDPEYSALARWAKRPINNANLAAITVYYRYVQAFEILLDRNGGVLEKYFSEVKSLSKLAKEDLRKKMESLIHED